MASVTVRPLLARIGYWRLSPRARRLSCKRVVAAHAVLKFKVPAAIDSCWGGGGGGEGGSSFSGISGLRNGPKLRTPSLIRKRIWPSGLEVSRDRTAEALNSTAQRSKSVEAQVSTIFNLRLPI